MVQSVPPMTIAETPTKLNPMTLIFDQGFFGPPKNRILGFYAWAEGRVKAYD